MTTVFSQPSTLPYELPPLDTITAQDLIDGVREGIEDHSAQIREIADSTEPATFQNTFVALELAGQPLRRAVATAWNIIPSHGTPEMQAAEVEIMAMITAHNDSVEMDPALTARLAQADVSALSGEDARLVEVVTLHRRLAGAELGEHERTHLAALNEEISRLSTAFGQRTSADLNEAGVLLSEEEAAGLSASQLAATAAAAREAGHESGHLLTLILPSSQPALSVLESSEARRRLHESSVSRGSAEEGGTLSLALRVVALRAQRAQLLGFADHAALTLAERSETDLSKVTALLDAAVPAALVNATLEDERIAEFQGAPTQPWDRARGLAGIAAKEYGVDGAALREWFELDRVLEDGVFRAAKLVYGVTLTPRPDLPVHHPDARVWEVFDEDGSGLGLFIGDFFTRPTKRGGAWMNSLRDGASALDERPVVMNNLNIPAPAEGEPALCTLDDVHTLFHEFGHALHALFSTARYPSLAGTAVPRDIVEYPSQVNELWAEHPQILPHYAVHVRTGEPLPEGTLDALKAAATWGEGFATSEYLAAALLDLDWHGLAAGEEVEDALEFEERALASHGFDPATLPPRYRTGYFQHIFESGYSAGYYSYFWAEVLDADTVEWFEEQPDVRAAGQRFREEFLARGNTRDALESYRAFRGRDAGTEPLLRRRGLLES
ncbi:M3 family metallopeptidase [Galactobacter caseinivorans]|uniref:M3 family peptidase n=1 Tax=Galactobacter caseinivorans TaxID=2676123 RepID=A0A496PLB6_9MICC|nr:M3 family metallopeptidase [Galactobacter caseinivorans]RKW71217.1 M3 family peptidase [Galactobacter caseinivorans]